MNLVSVVCLCLLSVSAWGASLVGSDASKERQTEEAWRGGFVYIESDQQLEWAKEVGLLRRIPDVPWIRVDIRLPQKFQWLGPDTLSFLDDLASHFYCTFGRPLQVNSAVRTVVYQGQLLKVNGNAAAMQGRHRSVHPTGAAFDLAKLGRTEPELAWLRRELLLREALGLIEATEEHFQAVFHIMVFAPRE